MITGVCILLICLTVFAFSFRLKALFVIDLISLKLVVRVQILRFINFTIPVDLRQKNTALKQKNANKSKKSLLNSLIFSCEYAIIYIFVGKDDNASLSALGTFSSGLIIFNTARALSNFLLCDIPVNVYPNYEKNEFKIKFFCIIRFSFADIISSVLRYFLVRS